MIGRNTGWMEPQDGDGKRDEHGPECDEKCQCEEPEMEMSRQDIEDARGDYEYQLMKDREAEYE